MSVACILAWAGGQGEKALRVMSTRRSAETWAVLLGSFAPLPQVRIFQGGSSPPEAGPGGVAEPGPFASAIQSGGETEVLSRCDAACVTPGGAQQTAPNHLVRRGSRCPRLVGKTPRKATAFTLLGGGTPPSEKAGYC